MSHTVRKANFGNSAIGQVVFTSYTAGQGGEQFTLAEWGLSGSVVGIFLLQFVDVSMGHECDAKYCKYMGAGKLMLMNPATPDQELPTSASLSKTILAFVQGS